MREVREFPFALRGRHNRKSFCLMLLISAISLLIICLVSRSFFPGLLALLGDLALIFVWYHHARAIDRELTGLSDLVDRTLRGESSLSIDSSEEGAFAILTGELEKMAVQLRTEADQKKIEKQKMSRALADIAHQLRTPLTALNLNMDLLMRGNQKMNMDLMQDQNESAMESRSRQMHEMRRCLLRMEYLVEAMLKLAKLDSGTVQFKREPVLLREMLTRAAEPLRIPMELKEQKLVIAGDGSFIGDMDWSLEAVGNILKNCMEHTPEGKEICVSIEDSPIAAVIVIQDQGEGFSLEDQARIFDRFYRGKNASPQSVGIGLALAREIILAQNGTVKAENIPKEKGGGAMFTIRFYKQVI